jgi:hypothetical protein
MKRLIQGMMVCALVGAGGVSGMRAVPAQAQHMPAQRVVQGRVQDKSGSPVKGATVFLKDSRTSQIRSFLTDAQGKYHIVQLSPNADYEVWAELNGKKSASRSISSFETNNDITANFKLDR